MITEQSTRTHYLDYYSVFLYYSFTKEKHQAYEKTDKMKETKISFYKSHGDFN